MTPSSTLAPGTLLASKYRVVRLLGEGGMGAVYEAVHALTDKQVAVKWLHPHLADNEQAVERFLREAKAAARVRHPNVVDVYDVGHERGTAFLVMEYLEGEPLSALLRRGGVPMHEVIATLIPAMRAVSAAHRQGIVHRDIKPENLFLTHMEDQPARLLKVLDFGISKLAPRGGEQLTLTKTGSTLGTPMYMSFEQLSGVKDVDARADVYAFGVILYEALTGQAPYQAETFPELIVKVATTTPVSPKELRSDIPTALARVVQWAMSKERDARIPSMEALVRELEPFATRDGFQTEMTLAGQSVPSLRPHMLTSASQGAQTPVPALKTGPELGPITRGRRWGPIAAGMVLLLFVAGVFWHDRRVPDTALPASLPQADSTTAPKAHSFVPESPSATTREVPQQAAQQEPPSSSSGAPDTVAPLAPPASTVPAPKRRGAPALTVPPSQRPAVVQARQPASTPAATAKQAHGPKAPASNFRVRILPKSADF